MGAQGARFLEVRRTFASARATLGVIGQSRDPSAIYERPTR